MTATGHERPLSACFHVVSHEGIQLAPFYDLLSVAVYDSPAFDKNAWPARTELAWPILGVNQFVQVDRALLLEAGAALNLAKGTAERLLAYLRGRAVLEAEALLAEVEAGNARSTEARTAPTATMAREARCLRTILHAVIMGMATRIDTSLR